MRFEVLTAVMKIQAHLPCALYHRTSSVWQSAATQCSILRVTSPWTVWPYRWRTMILQNIAQLLAKHTASHSGDWIIQIWELKILKTAHSAAEARIWLTNLPMDPHSKKMHCCHLEIFIWPPPKTSMNWLTNWPTDLLTYLPSYKSMYLPNQQNN